MAAERYRCVIVGAGQGGKPLALALARAGWRTALVERARIGGTCVNYGCTPTKTLIASAAAAWTARTAGPLGVRTGRVEVDMRAVRQRTRDVVESFHEGSRKSVEGVENLEVIFGEASFTAPRELRVRLREGGGERTLSAETIVVDTGTSPAIPPIDGLEAVRFFDSTAMLELGELPDRLLVLGGGYVGVEFAQMFRRFGAEVTLLQRGDQLLPREDRDVAERLAGILREDGIDVRLGAEVRRVKPTAGVATSSAPRVGVCLQLADGTLVEGTHLLVATGRRPNTGLLNLEAAGIETAASGAIRVDAALRTTAEGVYAIGDVNGGPAFTQISYDDFRVLRRRLLEGEDARTTGRPVPYAVFTDPQLGRIGLNEREARSAGRPYKIARLPVERIARASEIGQTRGLLKALVDPRSDRILGAAALAPEGGEIAAMIQIAMMGGLRARDLRDGIFTHPSWSESLNSLFASLEDPD